MKKSSSWMKGHFIARSFLVLVLVSVQLVACHKDPPTNNGSAASNYSSEVLDKWMSLQLRLMRNATGIPNQAFSRHFAYSGIVALESLAAGLPASFNQYRKWNGLNGLPAVQQSVKYYYPANVNAGMAAINRSLFPTASAADKAAIDSLENALYNEFLTREPASILLKSAEFGQAVASAVYGWAETDGYKNANAAYTPPVGPGLWVPTPPANAAASTPYWGNNRPVVSGSTNNSMAPAPIAYSTDPTSAFYKMVKHVYDVSTTLTDAQKTTAMYWRDVPGVTSPGHWLSIAQQVLRQTNSRLDKAALAYALTGAAVNDGLISCWKSKFQYNLVRPISFIRDVMGYNGWNSYIGTPPHPEYPSAHTILSVAAGSILDKLFDKVNSFTDHTYDYLGFAPRTYTSFMAIADEAGLSRIYGGIHYQPSIEAGTTVGKKVATNIIGGNGHP
jgi:hypothetical protein